MDQPIIIKKVKKGGHGHHGGAWKIAYADFVTAMMAFFLLLWLLNSVTQEQLEGISDYFSPVSTSTSTSGSGDVLAGKVIAEEGALQADRAQSSVTVDLPPPKAGQGLSEAEGGGTPDEISEDALDKLVEEREEQQFEEAEQALRDAIEANPQFRQLAKSLMIENTPEGLRIQLVDQEGLAMFPRGSPEMYLHTRKVIELVAGVIQQMPQDLAISGHTDATPFVTDSGYGNWELSADRANAARRALVRYGIPAKRIARVTGRAATEPLLAEDPEAPGNRRLSVVLLRGTGAPPQEGGTQEQ